MGKKVKVTTIKEVKICGIWYCNDKIKEYKLNILDKNKSISRPIKVNSKTTVYTSCYCVLDLLYVNTHVWWVGYLLILATKSRVTDEKKFFISNFFIGCTCLLQIWDIKDFRPN